MEKEDGEMSDDNAMLVDNVDITKENKDTTLLYKADKNGIFVEQLEKVDAAKLDERAKRFGLNLTGNRVITAEQIDELYHNFGIESGNERHFRFDSLHLSGVGDLTTKDIFEYLEDYKPVSLEWINDISCNVVCQDHISAALALLVHSREITNKDLKEMLAENSAQHWREGVPHPKKDLILMRFSTNSDKKINKKNKVEQTNKFYNHTKDTGSKNPWGDLCQSWGIYDHQEVFTRRPDYYEDDDEVTEFVQIKNKKLASRLGKRRQHEQKVEESDSDTEWKKKSKAPRMRMHADDEESKQKKKTALERIKVESDPEDESYAPLSIEVVNSRSSYAPRTSGKLSDKFKYHNKPTTHSKEGIQSRLGAKVATTKELSEGYSTDDSEKNIVSRVQKVNTKRQFEHTKSSNVWSRLESTSSAQPDLRQRLKSKPTNNKSKPDDLRDRICKSKQSNLRIEIDNNYTSD